MRLREVIHDKQQDCSHSGITGQDGAYVTQWLLDRGYHIIGASRDAQMNRFATLDPLRIRVRVVCRWL